MIAVEPVVFSSIGGVLVTLALGTMAWFLNKKQSGDTNSLGLIKASQDWSQTAITQATAEIVLLRHQVTELRVEQARQSAEAQGKLDVALAHHAECERTVLVQQALIVDLQTQLLAALTKANS